MQTILDGHSIKLKQLNVPTTSQCNATQFQIVQLRLAFAEWLFALQISHRKLWLVGAHVLDKESN